VRGSDLSGGLRAAQMDDTHQPAPGGPVGDEVIAHVGGEVDSCSVCLRVFGDDLDPEAVSAALKAAPTLSCRKGDLRGGRRGNQVEKQGKWLLDLDHDSGLTLDDLINQLLDRLTCDLAVWRELIGRYRVDLFCGLQMKCWNRGLSLSPRTLQRLGERGLELGLDIYYVGDDEPG
jgi:hypothetical protein